MVFTVFLPSICVPNIHKPIPLPRPTRQQLLCSEYNNLNPDWSTVITLDDFRFGVPMYIEVGVFDFDARAIGEKESRLAREGTDRNEKVVDCSVPTSGLESKEGFPHKIMGTALFEVGDILGSRGSVQSKLLTKGAGVVCCQIEKRRLDGEQGRVRFKLRAEKLSGVRSFGRKSSPYFHLFRKVERPTGATWCVHYIDDGDDVCLPGSMKTVIAFSRIAFLAGMTHTHRVCVCVCVCVYGERSIVDCDVL